MNIKLFYCKLPNLFPEAFFFFIQNVYYSTEVLKERGDHKLLDEKGLY